MPTLNFYAQMTIEHTGRLPREAHNLSVSGSSPGPATEQIEVAGRTYNVIRHFRKRARETGKYVTKYVADRTGRKHRVRVPETEQKLVQVGVQYVRADRSKKLGRRAKAGVAA